MNSTLPTIQINVGFKTTLMDTYTALADAFFALDTRTNGFHAATGEKSYAAPNTSDWAERSHVD